MANCECAVSGNCSSGPSKHSFDSAKPRVASASSKTARASGEASYRALPIPLFCDPCPGTKQASLCAVASVVSLISSSSPAHGGRGPGQAAAERRHQQQIALLDLPLLHG